MGQTARSCKERKRIVVSIPASAELRKQLEENFKKNLPLMSKYSQAPKARRCMADEFKSGVDTKWLQESGVLAAKDHMTVKDYLQIESQLEEKLAKAREPALRVAQKLLS
jgi:hypothetical protein